MTDTRIHIKRVVTVQINAELPEFLAIAMARAVSRTLSEYGPHLDDDTTEAMKELQASLDGALKQATRQ